MSKAVPSVPLAGLVGSSNACNSRRIGVTLTELKILKTEQAYTFSNTLFPKVAFSLWPWKKKHTGYQNLIQNVDTGLQRREYSSRVNHLHFWKSRNYQFKLSSASTCPLLHSKCDMVSVHCVPQSCWGLPANKQRPPPLSRWTRHGPKHTEGPFFSVSRYFL